MTPGPPSDGPAQEIRSEGVWESPAQETGSEGPRSYEECADIATEGPENQVDDRLYACYLEFPMHEDDPRWECRTMGNRICGPLPETT